MKKIFAALTIITLLSFTVGSYVTYNYLPRYAPTPLNAYVDNTGRNLTYAYDSLATDAVGNDTLYVQPNASKTLV